MKIQTLQNAVEAFDFDIFDDEHIPDLGRAIADHCCVVVRQKLTEERHYDVISSWGSRAASKVIGAIALGILKGVHWNGIRMTTANVGSLIDPRHRDRMQSVTFQKDRKGRALGIFANGKLGWHSDQPAFEDSQWVIGLASVEGSQNSQTTVLCTAEPFSLLSQDDITQVSELECVYVWDEEKSKEYVGELIREQQLITRYNGCPIDNLVSPFMAKTASGVPGIHFPGSLFSHFKGMGKDESQKFLKHIWDKCLQDKYIYTHNWQDGEVLYMDNAITLHARPTRVKDGDMRRMWRCTGYLDKLYPEHGPRKKIKLEDGRELTWPELFEQIDAQRKEEYEEEKHKKWRDKWSKVFERMP